MAQVFKKSAPNNPVSLSTGKAMRFEDFGNNTGYLVTDDPVIISEFNRCISEGRGGLSVVSMEEYQAAVKKKQTSPVSRASSFREVQTAGLVTIVLPPTAPAAAAPAEVPVELLDKPVVPAKAPEPKIGKRPQ